MNTTVEILGFAREPAWLPWAVTYFFLIGISTSAFLLSLPGLAWRHPDWRNVSRRALLVALVCGLAGPVALLADLHQPGRFLNFYLHPNLGSWMAWGSFFIPLYLSGLFLYAWLCLRPQLAALGGSGAKFAGVYRLLALGGHDNPGAIKAAALLGGIGAALILLYTGMEVMVVQARPLWHSPVLPLLFLVTALSGGLGMTGLFEALGGHKTAAPLLNRWLVRSQWATLLLLLVWWLTGVSGLSRAAAEALAAMQGAFSWWVTGAWLMGSTLLTLWLASSRRHTLVLPALFALQGAWLVRWVVLMVSQSLPKMGATTPHYALTLTPDGLLGIVGMVGLCLTLYIVLTSLIPWDDLAQDHGVQS
ncbi:NrfD/PsrC family molybdoenzyme membrane anchor subunit [Rhodoferax sp.]|uniref:NrfD/PsrC family molybdoenzyme membrane anchor subunit n=1 Tax=Rhodoferax sp. TaxID=50421 RepID=UPI0025E81B79|nr:NrfD/PsrC family molybdoenzyme membrane anchor subunit [Rhodoferax sp.]MCM2340091.1 polysulfide reductase NrfD [Rhodoferax sp.]